MHHSQSDKADAQSSHAMESSRWNDQPQEADGAHDDNKAQELNKNEPPARFLLYLTQRVYRWLEEDVHVLQRQLPERLAELKRLNRSLITP